MIRINIALVVGFLMYGVRYYIPINIESASNAIFYDVGAILVIAVLAYVFLAMFRVRFQKGRVALSLLSLGNIIFALHLGLRFYYTSAPPTGDVIEAIMNGGGYREYVDLLQPLGIVFIVVGIAVALSPKPQIQNE